MEEIERVELLFKIPISKIIDFSNHVEIYSQNQSIGSIPYVIDSKNKRLYDKSEIMRNNLNWNKIYLNNQIEIKVAIKKLLNIEDEDIRINLGTFRNLYINNEDNQYIAQIHCFYEKEIWVVRKLSNIVK
ncbi:hypothetical protein SD427_06770 [Chryseobacterium sp. JJR-5R]|uniref:hypothetical protein n=1 Tax=Chryseobacterium sp. JJR-5R TaxID=3093923 RepID=UPI002A74F72E|nr:hypothetical protein [Chryseobacterium sp. JJR-5R]WPO84027.1 hypothetical protein SD427_06770 [Chryseobacterium sp. JJR-5R]